VLLIRTANRNDAALRLTFIGELADDTLRRLAEKAS
jgi:hypothetical protein